MLTEVVVHGYWLLLRKSTGGTGMGNPLKAARVLSGTSFLHQLTQVMAK